MLELRIAAGSFASAVHTGMAHAGVEWRLSTKSRGIPMKILSLVIFLIASTSYASEPSCSVGQDAKIAEEIALHFEVLAEVVKQKKGIDYDLQALKKSIAVEISHEGNITISDPRGDVSVQIKQAGYTSKKGTPFVIRVSGETDYKKFDSTSDTVYFISSKVGVKHDKEGNVTNPGHCEIQVGGWFFGSPSVVSLFNANSKAWIYSLSLKDHKIVLN